MSRKLFTAAFGVLTIFVSATFVPSSSASPSKTPIQHRPAGLTQHGIDLAKDSGLPGNLVTMAPQSSLTLLQRASEIGPHDPSAKISLTIGLKLRNAEQLKQFLRSVQDPHSAVYRKFLTPKQFAEQYGPSEAQVAAVERFLKQSGIAVKNVSSNHILIHTEAATGVYESAFGITINDYKLGGRSFYSTADRPKLPRAIAPLVANVLGLNHGVLMRPHNFMKPLGATAKGLGPREAPSASTAEFNPFQIAKAYDWPDITNPNNGAGVSVAIITADSSGLGSDDSPESFWNAYGLPNHTINVIPVDGDYGSTDGLGETLLDMEWSGAMAPGITLNVYVASGPYDSTFTDAYNQFVTDDTSQVMTTSWGSCDAGDPYQFETDEGIFMQAAAQGISMFAAAGDHGSSDSPPSNPCYAGTPDDNADYPSSSAYVAAANGTQLTISNVDGTYGSEVVWNDDDCFGQGPASTGGGISAIINKPAWQTGPGVPTDVGMRMNSDMAMNASCSHPYVLYADGQWYLVGGTSAVAPQLAGLFAVGVSQQPNELSLGQSNKLIYDDVNAGNYASDFRDVTQGNNGAFQAGPNWDHPTGWGSPKATSFLSHIGSTAPAGTLTGTITDASSGQPIGGAVITIMPGDFQRTTMADGTYSINLLVGNYTVTAADFGYKAGSASVAISSDNTTTQNFALAAAPTATLSGTVTDGAGHGYPLYADIKVSTQNFGQVADVWTNPKTGQYSVTLPEGNSYTLNVAAALDGYDTASKTVTLTGDTSQDFPLGVLDTCSAPGYQFVSGGFGEDFNGATFPPTGWTVTNPDSTPVIWELSSAEPENQNNTGGTGTAAEGNNQNNIGPGSPAFDTSLVTPPIAVTSLNGASILTYKTYFTGGSTFPLDLDITTDGGTTWTNILHWTTGQGDGFPPGEDVRVNLASYLPASGDFQLRWRWTGPADVYFSGIAQIDDVVIGACEPVPGGLVMGQVSDANTGNGVLGAHVADENGTGSETVENPDDPNLPVGFYLFYDATGQHTLTASAYSNYSSATAAITLNNNAVVVQNFALKAARLEANPGQFTLNVMVNSSATASFALSNTGSAPGQFRVIGIDSPAPATQSPAMGGGVPLIQVPVANHAWLTASLPWVARQAAMSGASRSRSSATSLADDLSPHAGSGWQAIAPYPKDVADNTAARDPATDKIYSMGGTYTQYGSVAGIDNSAYVYDPKADAWSPIADAPVAREAAASAFINDKYYVVNGWASGAAADPVAEMDIYDPSTGQWSTGAPNPVPAGGGSAYAVLNGSLYIVGGCNNGACNTPTDAVQVYHPVSDSWTSAANYPQSIKFASCGAIDGKLYCAGGIQGGGAIGNSYVYDPSSNSWSPIASMFLPLGESFYTAANGMLLVSGGVEGGGSIVNESEAYDPQTNSWFPLPNLPMADSRGGYACGFYQLGGIVGYNPFFGAITTAESNVLPGYTQQCGMVPPPAWLTVAPASGTLTAGSSSRITLGIDGTGQAAFTTSKAYLSVANRSPYGPVIVPITVTWDPQPVHLVLTGTTNLNPIQKGNTLVYTLTVQNQQMSNHGAATETQMSYVLPAGVSYVASNGDASCTAPSAGSSQTPASATSGPGSVVCSFGTIDEGASKTESIAVQAADAGTLTSHFEITSREPDDSDSNTLDISTTVTGTADMSASSSDVTIPSSADGTIQMNVSNAGPDTATNVALKVTSGTDVKLLSATSSEGSCLLVSGQNALSCDIGDVPSGQSVSIAISAYGAYTGTATVTGQVTTSAQDPDQTNNVTTSTATVTSSGGGGGGSSGGGGALGWLALAGLLGLALAGALARRRHS